MITTSLRDDVDLTRGMHAVVTGSGSALVDSNRGGASAAVIVDGIVLQFDCGRMVMENLVRAGINPVDVDTLFLTHLHFDHIANFGYFIISNWIAGRDKILEVYGPEGTAKMAHHMVFDGHSTDVEFARGLVRTWHADVPGRPQPEPPFTVGDIGPGVVVETDRYKVTAAPVPHFQRFGVMSLGYRVDSEHGSIVVTGDCRPCDEVKDLARGADIMIHECAKPDGDMVTGGKFSRSSTLQLAEKEHTHPHTTPTWLGEVARDAGVRTVVATHLAPLDALPAARAMSRIYYGTDPVRADIFEMYRERIRKNFSGDVLIASDGLVVSV